jgi:hypothetical protein
MPSIGGCDGRGGSQAERAQHGKAQTAGCLPVLLGRGVATSEAPKAEESGAAKSAPCANLDRESIKRDIIDAFGAYDHPEEERELLCAYVLKVMAQDGWRIPSTRHHEALKA